MFVFYAAPGNVIDHVVIERESESTVMFVEGAKEAYLGYVTLKVRYTNFYFSTSHKIIDDGLFLWSGYKNVIHCLLNFLFYNVLPF